MTLELDIEADNEIYHLSVRALLDSGSAVSLIKKKLVKPELIKNVANKSESYVGINKSKLNVLRTIKINVRMIDKSRTIDLLVVDNDTMYSPVSLGRDALRQFGLRMIEGSTGYEEAVGEILNIDVEGMSEEKEMKINPEVESKHHDRLRKLYELEYIKPVRPVTHEVKMKLKLILKAHQPFRFTPRRLSYSEKTKLKKIVEVLKKKEYIVESDAEYASPIVLIRKKRRI